MPSTFTGAFNLEKPANGEQDTTWGDTTNANMDKIDAALRIAGRRFQVFGSSGSWTVPKGVFWVKASVIGGGGGGSNSANSTPGAAYSSGGGGGAGGFTVGYYAVTPDQIIPVTVGAGGVAQQNGSASSFGTFATAYGGVGASFGAAVNISAGGPGGFAVGGTLLNAAGNFGSDGQNGAFTFAGNGGAGPLGGSGRAAGGNGFPGQAVGSGGGGAYGGTYTGGAGAPGYVFLEF